MLSCLLLAWGYTGHQLVAALAMSMLSDATWIKMKRILNRMAPAQACNWPDEVRSDQFFAYTIKK